MSIRQPSRSALMEECSECSRGNTEKTLVATTTRHTNVPDVTGKQALLAEFFQKGRRPSRESSFVPHRDIRQCTFYETTRNACDIRGYYVSIVHRVVLNYKAVAADRSGPLSLQSARGAAGLIAPLFGGGGGAIPGTGGSVTYRSPRRFAGIEPGPWAGVRRSDGLYSAS